MPFLLQAWSRFGLCLFPKWMDCVLSSAGSSGSLGPSACEHACDLYSGPLPVSDHNTHSQIWANEQNKCRRKMLYSWSTELLTWVILWRKAWNHQNAIPPSVPPLWLHMLLCGWAETVRLSIWLGGRSASPLWSSASRSCTNEQDSDPWDHMTILGAHWLILPMISSDRKWPVSASCDTKWPLCFPLCQKAYLWQCDDRYVQIRGFSGMAGV